MAGAPSQLDLFDYKPALAKYNGKPVPQEVVMGQKYAFIKPDAALFAPRTWVAKNSSQQNSGNTPHAVMAGARIARRIGLGVTHDTLGRFEDRCCRAGTHGAVRMRWLFTARAIDADPGAGAVVMFERRAACVVAILRAHWKCRADFEAGHWRG